MSERIDHVCVRRTVTRALVGLALLVPALATAAPCDLRRNEDGTWSGNCSLSELLKNEFRLDVQIYRSTPRYRLKLPNLQPRKMKYILFGQSVEALIDVRNLGEVPSKIVDAAVIFTITDPRNGHSQVQSVTATNSVPIIQPGTEQRVYLATFALPNSEQDWDITAVAAVDPPTATSPTWGALWESNEMDNTLVSTCRVYGPNPDTSVPPCN